MRDYPIVNTTYELTVNDGVTSVSKSVAITVLETKPVTLTLEGRPMDQIFEGDEVLVTATSGFSSYKLLLNNEVIQEVGLNNGVSFQAELGKYFIRVFATDDNFCVTQDQLVVDIESRKLPNVFTPNDDGINELFLAGFDLQVFNRTGQLLYNGTEGWDGKYKGKKMPQGTYLYVVRRIMNNGELRIFKGTVTLKL
jgi:gliding motility-associated-like protein